MNAIDAIRAIVSDVDNTLLGNDEALERFSSWYAQHGSEITLIYASGRTYESVVESIQSTALPTPDYIIGGVGTDIREYGAAQPSGKWRERFENRFDAQVVIGALSDHPALEIQPEDCCSEYKVSYFLRDAGPGELHRVRALLADASIDAELIYSSSRDLDILPAGVNKGSAARYVVESLGIRCDNVIACGDSENDLSMFRHGFRGVVVGNAHEELRSIQSPDIHQAEGEYATGVLEGLERWGAMAPSSERNLVGAGSH